MHKLLEHRAAEEEKTPKAPSGSVMDFAEQHRDEVFRSDKEAPERFADLRTLDGHGRVDPGDFLVPNPFAGSLMDRDAVKMGNNRVFQKRYGDQEGVFNLQGDHGAYGVAIRISAITESMLDDLKVLTDYPGNEEEEGAPTEHRKLDEAWDDWVHYEFVRALERRFPEAEIAIDEMDNDQARTLFELVRTRVGIEWLDEEERGLTIDIEKIAQDCTEQDLYGQVDDTPEVEEEPVAE